MGPRSEERGNGQRSDRVDLFWLASMGPRSEERGNCRLVNKTDARACASMGPRSEERGNVSPADSSTISRPGFNGAALRGARKLAT